MDQQLIYKIWFSGFYEGEGSVSNDKSNNNRIRLSISQNDITPLLLAKKIWGGSVIEKIRTSLTGKICHGNEWRLSQNPALKFIEDIKPFMIIPYKINQIVTALEKMKEGNDETYKCNFCDNIYKNPGGRRRHELKEHINKGVLHKCDIELCERTFKSKDSLNRHKRINHRTKIDEDKAYINTFTIEDEVELVFDEDDEDIKKNPWDKKAYINTFTIEDDEDLITQK